MENRLADAKREGQRRRLRLADVKLLYIEGIKKKKVLLYGTENYIQ